MKSPACVHDLEHRIAHLERTVDDLTGALAHSQQTVDLLDAVQKTQSRFITEADPFEIYQSLLQILVEITSSQYGFLDEVVVDAVGRMHKQNLAMSNIAWDDASRRLYRQLQDRDMCFTGLDNLAGLPGLTGKTVIANDPPHDPRAKGLPAGHPALQSFLGMPLFYGDKLVGVAGVANRAGGYDEAIAAFLEPLRSTCAGIIYALRKEAEEKCYRTMMETSNEGIWAMDRSHRTTYVNPAMARMLGYPPQAMHGRPVTDFMVAEDLDDHRVKMQRRESGLSDVYERRFRRQDGTELWASVSARAKLDARGGFDGSFAIFTDITERKRAESALKLHQVIVESALEPMAVIDSRYTYLLVNQSYETFWGGCREAIIGKRVPELLGQTVFENTVKANVDRCLAGEAVKYSAWFDSPSHGRRYMNLNYYPFRDDSGAVIGLINIAYDSTDQQLAEDSLRRKENMLTRTEALANTGSWEWEVATDTVTWSDELFRLFQRDPAMGAPSFADHAQLYPPEDTTRLRHCVAAALTDAAPYEISLNAIRPNGEIRRCLAHGFPEKDATGKVHRLYGFVQDMTDRDRTLHELKQLAHDQATILDNVPAYIYFKDTQNNIIRVSESVARVTGRPKSEIEGHHSLAVYPQTAESYYADDLEVIRSGKPKMGIIEPLPVTGGETRWLSTDKIPYFDDDGHVAGVIIMASDITDRIAAENQTKASEAKFRSLFEYAGDAIYLVSMQGRILDVNEAAERQTGYPRRQLLQMQVGDLDPRAVTENDRENIWQTLIPGKTVVLPTRHRRADGQSFPVEINMSVMDWDAQPVIVGFARDMTEKTAMLESLRSSEERLSLAFRGANDGLWDWNMETDDVFYSPRWKSMLGYADHEIENRFSEWERLIDPDDREKAWAVMRDYLDGRRDNFTCEFRMRHKHGGWVDILSRAFVIRRGTDDRPVRVIGTHVDITERRKMDKRLQQVQKMEAIGTLAGGIAHDFNNILFPIVGFAEMLVDDLPPGSDTCESAKEILQSARRAGKLVKQILSFSRQVENKKEPQCIQQILKEVFRLTRATIPADIAMHQRVQKDCRPVRIDPTQMHQIAMNLITNAFHAVEGTGGEIGVELEETTITDGPKGNAALEPGDYAVLSVADTGHGIDPALMPKLFEPYFTTKAQGKGTGLGLSVVYGIVKECQGDIQVTSQPGNGARFDVYLPVIDEDPGDEAPQPATPDPTGHERILLVDDEEPILRTVRRTLKRLGYQVEIHLSSPEALEAFRAQPDEFDLVITDMTMPNLTGDHLAAEMIAIRPDLPIIMCTGFSERIDPEKASRMGIRGFLMKPVVKSDLARLVRRALDRGGHP